MINAPREVLREFGTVIGGDVTVRVHDSTADMRYLIDPQRPPDTDGWTEAQLAELVDQGCDDWRGGRHAALISLLVFDF